MSSDAAKNAYPDSEWAHSATVEAFREAYDRGAREKAAEAWDEGRTAHFWCGTPVNPYREDQS